MPRVRDLLDRFRPAGAPGAASGAGMPVDTGAGIAAELKPVFAVLDEVQRECQRIRQAADARAADIRAEAATRAEAMIAQAHADAAAARDSAATRRRRRGERGIAGLTAGAEREAAAIRLAARQSEPELIARTMAEVRAQLAAFGPEPATTAGGPR